MNREIIAEFTDGRAVRYTTSIYDMLVSDASVISIIDAETGELLFMRGGRK